jgi:hypothetical protein
MHINPLKGSEEFYAAVAIAFAQFQAQYGSKIPLMTPEEIYQDAFFRGTLAATDFAINAFDKALQAADPLERAHRIAELIKQLEKEEEALSEHERWYRGTLNG